MGGRTLAIQEGRSTAKTRWIVVEAAWAEGPLLSSSQHPGARLPGVWTGRPPCAPSPTVPARGPDSRGAPVNGHRDSGLVFP